MASKSVMDAAVVWFRELDQAEQIEDKWEAFEAWLMESPAHQAAFTRIEELLFPIHAFGGGDPDSILQQDLTGARGRARSWLSRARVLGLSLISIVAAIVSAVVRTELTRGRPVLNTDAGKVFKTTVGEHRTSVEPALVSAEQVAIITDRGLQVSIVTSAETERRTAWIHGELQFAGESLQEAVQEFNRYNRIRLRIVDTTLRKLPINGVFSPTDPRGFVLFLRHSFDVRSLERIDTDAETTIDLMGGR